MSAYDPPEPSDETYPDWYDTQTAPDDPPDATGDDLPASEDSGDE